MAGDKDVGTVKRFGARYGRSIRHRVALIDAVRFAKKKCPYCHAWKVKRKSVGIWHCLKCKALFTGKAYTIAERIIIKEEITETPEQQVEEQEELESTEEKEEV